ncbi:MAG: SDR family NAD(P)-dependent oxidoreductase, partial [Myxococcales bacterium]|nr:SDR family NAD(P)-dependent oxidoreductase [Myxococcales bacterium]
TTATPAAAEPGASDAEIQAKVLGVVSEVTGYPPDMLDLDLDLEADLGIDTVKQAETFAAVREAYGIERDPNLQLRDFPTLAHVIQFVVDRLPKAEAVTSPTPTAAAASTTSPDASAGASGGGITRRVPIAVLRPPLSVCKPTGVALGAGRRVAVMGDRGALGSSLVDALRARGVEVLVIEGDPTVEALSERLAPGRVDGIYWLTGVDPHEPIERLSAEAFDARSRRDASLLHAALHARVRGDDPAPFLVAATAMGGRHGFDEAGPRSPLAGAVVGLAKAYQREQPDTLVKAVDFEPGAAAADVAEALIEETLRDPGSVEIGRTPGRRHAISVREQARTASADGLVLGSDTVYVVTGAAGSIVSAIVADLARTGGTFHLLDLAPAPDPADPDLRALTEDRDGLKRRIFERLKAGGERGTPAQVERELARLERAAAAVSAIAAIEAAGGQARYVSVDLRDGAAVRAALEGIDRVDVLLHAAGLEISRRVADKSPEEFDLVFGVKARGWHHLLSAIGDRPLRSAVVFSSIAGRFGNVGQTDYAAANELLARSVAELARRRGIVGLALDWTAWAEIGMASRGSIPTTMAAAGIDMLPPTLGIPVVRDELTAGTRGEVVVGQRLGVLLAELDPTGGLDPAALGDAPRGPLSAAVRGMGLHGGLELDTTLDPAEQPFLFDHRIDGTAVLPGVMGLEGFGEAATLLLPDLAVATMEDVEFLAPFKFYRDQPRPVTVRATLRADGDDVRADCVLIGRRELVGHDHERVTEHFRASVRLRPAGGSAAPVGEAPPAPDGSVVEAADIYRVYFHGPTYQVLEQAWRAGGRVIGRMRAELPANHRPDSARTAFDPRLVELCFQTAGVWEIGTSGRMGLPHHIDRVVFHSPGVRPRGPIHAVVTPRDGGDGFDAHVIDGAGARLVELWGYRTAELPDPLDQERVAPLRAAMKG